MIAAIGQDFVSGSLKSFFHINVLSGSWPQADLFRLNVARTLKPESFFAPLKKGLATHMREAFLFIVQCLRRSAVLTTLPMVGERVPR